MLAATGFVAGFSLLFALAGAGTGVLGSQFLDHRRGLELVGGAIVIAMGVLMLMPTASLIGRCNERKNGRSSSVAARAASQTSMPMPTPLVDHGSNNATNTAMRSTLSMRANGSCRAEAMTDSIEPIEFISLRG